MSGPFPPEWPGPPDAVSFEQARAWVLERLQPLPARQVPLHEALGCVLAEDVTAAEDLPPFANSAMDGFALRAADVAGAGEDDPVPLRLAGEVFAGSARLPRVEPGTAVRIMTGGPLPPGADTVIPVERTSVAGETVQIRLAAGERAFVREAGEDVRAGVVVLEGGRPLDPAAIGMLASVGRREVPVHPRPRVAVASRWRRPMATSCSPPAASRWATATTPSGCWRSSATCGAGGWRCSRACPRRSASPRARRCTACPATRSPASWCSRCWCARGCAA